MPVYLSETLSGRLTSSRPDTILVTPIPIRSKPPSTLHFHQVQHARSSPHQMISWGIAQSSWSQSQ